MRVGKIAVVRVPYRSRNLLYAHCGIAVRVGPYVVFFRHTLPVSVCGRPLTEDERKGGAADGTASDSDLAEQILPGTRALFVALAPVQERRDAAALLFRKALLAVANSQKISDAGFAALGLPLDVIGPALAEARGEAIAAL